MSTRGTYLDASALNASPFGDALGKALLAGLGGYLQNQDRADERAFQGTQFAAAQDRLRAQDERQAGLDDENRRHRALSEALSKLGVGIDPGAEDILPGAGRLLADRAKQAEQASALSAVLSQAKINETNAQTGERVSNAFRNYATPVVSVMKGILSGKAPAAMSPTEMKQRQVLADRELDARGITVYDNTDKMNPPVRKMATGKTWEDIRAVYQRFGLPVPTSELPMAAPPPAVPAPGQPPSRTPEELRKGINALLYPAKTFSFEQLQAYATQNRMTPEEAAEHLMANGMTPEQ